MSELWTEGFLGTRSSFMMDLVCVALFGILLLLAISIYQVRVRRQYEWHKRCQLALGATLAVVVFLFELDVRFVTDWQARAEESPYFKADAWSGVWLSLTAHLASAVPTACLWLVAIVQALRRFPRVPGPGNHSRRHALLGWLAATGILLTALTGWLFYVLAFVAT